jgi:hypothetical protein
VECQLKGELFDINQNYLDDEYLELMMISLKQNKINSSKYLLE